MNIFKRKERKLSDRVKDYCKKQYMKWDRYINNNKNKYTIKELLVFMFIMFAFGSVIGGIISYSKGVSGSSKLLKEFASTYKEILNDYYEEVDDEELLQAGIEGMIDYLGDPYSSYMNQEESVAFSETVDGKYCGIGAEITYANEDYSEVKILSIVSDSPAEKAGLLVNDILLKVDDNDLTGMTVSQIASLVKGKEGTSVNITIKRDEEELTIRIIRKTIPIVTVQSQVFEESNQKVGYLQISVFADNTDEQLEEKLEELEKQKIDYLIIDVRNNSGGYLTTATNIASLFVEKGKAIYQLKTKDKVEIIKDQTKTKRTYPIIVLVNGGSASASELLAASLKESYGATILGTTTFGKGTAQRTHTLSNGAIIKYTYQEWLTPNGNSVNSIGITPDIELEYIYEQGATIDNQLTSAIKEIVKNNN